ncbi:MAG: hypothetical protein E7610_01200 [Ruminococcaceae bacterium]|nr:hypothetical protein [Oscillospiraceae bacterium]
MMEEAVVESGGKTMEKECGGEKWRRESRGGDSSKKVEKKGGASVVRGGGGKVPVSINLSNFWLKCTN